METKQDENIVRLIKHKKSGLLSFIFSRFFLVILLIAVQLLIVASLILILDAYQKHFAALYFLFTLVMVFYIFSCEMDSSAKLTWLFVIALFPIAGSLFFAYTKSNLGHRKLQENTLKTVSETMGTLPQSEETMKKISEDDPRIEQLSAYINLSGCFPIYGNTDVTYYPIGEEMFKAMLEEMEKAEKFIYMEYFIVDEGLMVGKLLDILIRKAAQGVDVRFMYDGMCEATTLPHKYPKLLQEKGIKAKTFAHLTPFVSTHYNYRDHRKILSIDGKVAFTGGINLADEYINEIEKFGHWKDTGLKLKGQAAESFTLMFLQMWNLTEEEHDYTTARSFQNALESPADPDQESSLPSATTNTPAEPDESDDTSDGFKGYVMPFCDNPMDDDKVAETVFMDMIYYAKEYVHIMTPYLILDDELKASLKYAAQRGVDVKLILPGVPDKKTAFALAKSHYKALMDAGVEIYEYTPGFVHAKTIVSDDKKAIVGTINFDYRSLYHHFECAAYIYKAPCIANIEEDFQNTLEKSQIVTEEQIRAEKGYRIAGVLLKPFAPLM